MRSTIKDVAKRAGVSAATVSLVLNNTQSAISKHTREVVIQAAQELDYRPNRLAVSLVTRRTNTLGLIIPDNRNSFQAAFSNQIELMAAESGYTLVFGIANGNIKKTLHHLYDFADRRVDGIILLQSVFREAEDTEACLKAITELRVPIILTDRVPETCPMDAIRINDFHGGYTAVKHLLDLGHRRIGIITGPMYLHNCVVRLNGCQKALSEAGVPFDPSLVYEGDFQIKSGENALPYLLDRQVTAIFAFNDMIAYGIYKELRNYRLTIPDDLSVIGFDDIFFSDVINPPLTTMKYPMKDMAAASVQRLIEQINGVRPGAAPVNDLIFNPILKVKASTRPL